MVAFDIHFSALHAILCIFLCLDFFEIEFQLYMCKCVNINIVMLVLTYQHPEDKSGGLKSTYQ